MCTEQEVANHSVRRIAVKLLRMCWMGLIDRVIGVMSRREVWVNERVAPKCEYLSVGMGDFCLFRERV